MPSTPEKDPALCAVLVVWPLAHWSQLYTGGISVVALCWPRPDCLDIISDRQTHGASKWPPNRSML